MSKKSVLPVILIVVLSGLYLAYQEGYLDRLLGPEEQEPTPDASTIRVAAFNIQVFGATKRGKPEVMEVLTRIAREFDVVLVQEIRDISGETAPAYLAAINGLEGPAYAYVESPRLGRTSSKESYAYYWNTATVRLVEGSAYVYNDTLDVYEREPFVASFTAGGFDFTLIGVHTKPEDARWEVGNLTIVADSVMAANPGEKDIIILGDLNADGSYFDEDGPSPLKAEPYIWVTSNSLDTMTKTDWTYDRVVITGASLHEYVDMSCTAFYFDSEYGLSGEIVADVSDHYPLYAVFRVDLADDD
ncbi:MAG TPA: endonuclease/exonuclease/phosphatase family protein [Candidatus Desulfaltia sp.]|nr:endonuclease/exonuclease/phosphatase family protein [Candidatus Desulfaltia sp.]